MTEGQLYRVAAATSAAAGALGAAAWFGRGARWTRAVRAIAALAPLVLVAAAWAWRAALAGHLPLFGTYESALSVALATVLAGAAFEARAQFGLGVAAFSALVAAALLAQGLRFDPAAYALTISERSLFVDVHAVIAWAAFGVLALNAGLAIATAAGAAAAERGLERTLELGFLLHSAMLATGMFYKFLLFGTAWSFDPVEAMGLAAWLAYGTLLHLQLLGGWTPRRLAAWCLVVFAGLAASYRLVVYFPSWATYHVFDVDLRLHLPR